MRDLPLVDIASSVGVTHQAIQQFERGKKRPTKPTLRKWLRTLNMPLELADQWEDDMISDALLKHIVHRTGDPRDAVAVAGLIRSVLNNRRK